MNKKMNIMLHTEIIDCLKPLTDESLARVMRMIFKWYEGETVEVENDFDRFAWAMILPRLERNKETYTQRVETNIENGKKGGAPKGNKNAKKQPKTTEGLIETTENNPKQHNLNLNLNNNISEDILLSGGIEQQETPEGVSVVSKGLESLENLFPENKRDIGIDEINRWNTLSQPQKSNVIRKASLYIRKEKKNENGKYMKKLSKWFKEEFDKGIEEEMKPKMKSSPTQTYKYVDGIIYSMLTEKVGSTKDLDYIYHMLNTSGLSKEEFFQLVRESNKQDLLNLLKK